MCLEPLAPCRSSEPLDKRRESLRSLLLLLLRVRSVWQRAGRCVCAVSIMAVWRFRSRRRFLCRFCANGGCDVGAGCTQAEIRLYEGLIHGSLPALGEAAVQCGVAAGDRPHIRRVCRFPCAGTSMRSSLREATASLSSVHKVCRSLLGHTHPTARGGSVNERSSSDLST